MTHADHVFLSTVSNYSPHDLDGCCHQVSRLILNLSPLIFTPGQFKSHIKVIQSFLGISSALGVSVGWGWNEGMSEEKQRYPVRCYVNYDVPQSFK